MRSTISILMGVLLFLSVRPLIAQKPAAKEAEPQQASVADLKKQLADARAKLREVESKIAKSEEMQTLRSAAEKAFKVYKEQEKSHPVLAKAREAEEAARATWQKAVDAALAESEAAAPILKQRAALVAEQAEHTYQHALAQFKLTHAQSPLNRALAKDSALAELKAAAESTAGEARKAALAAYQKARQAKVAALEEGKALLEQSETARKGYDAARQGLAQIEQKLTTARRAVEKEVDSTELKSAAAKVRDAFNSPELKASRDANNLAVRKHNERLKVLTEADQAAAALRAQIKALTAKLAAAGKKTRKQLP